MESTQTVILEHQQVVEKITRLAIEILEHNYDEKEIILLGLNNTGYRFAELLAVEIRKWYDKKLTIKRIRLNPAKPCSDPITIEDGVENLRNKVLIVTDDVANTGRTLFYAFKPIMDFLPKKVEVAVLVNRKHKSFPVKVDYLGMEFATTIKEHIKVDIVHEDRFQVSLH